MYLVDELPGGSWLQLFGLTISKSIHCDWQNCRHMIKCEQVIILCCTHCIANVTVDVLQASCRGIDTTQLQVNFLYFFSILILQIHKCQWCSKKQLLTSHQSTQHLIHISTKYTTPNETVLFAYHAILFHFPFCFQLGFLATVSVNLSLYGFLFLFMLHLCTVTVKTWTNCCRNGTTKCIATATQINP